MYTNFWLYIRRSKRTTFSTGQKFLLYNLPFAVYLYFLICTKTQYDFKIYISIAGISSINGSLLSVSNDLSTQQIQVNCYTFRVEPNQVTWRIGSELIDSSYQPVTGSQLLDNVDQTYRHYITLNGSFNVGMSISCNTSVIGANSGLSYFPEGSYIVLNYSSNYKMLSYFL